LKQEIKNKIEINFKIPLLKPRHQIIFLENQGSTKCVGTALSNPEALAFRRKTIKNIF